MMRALLFFLLFSFVTSGISPHWNTPAQPGAITEAISFQWPAAYAQGTPNDDTCTSDFKEDTDEHKEGIVTQIVDYIKEIIDETTSKLYEGVIGHQGFLSAINAAFVLMIALFGAAFLFGIVPLTYGQALTRGVKIAVIAGLIGAGGFQWFDEIVITFFNDGTDYLIDKVIGIATGDTSGVSVSDGGSPQPFRKLEEVAMDALSPEMMVSLLTSFTTGPMGPAIGGLLGIALVAFIQMLIKALRVYAISLVAKALLLGLAPIFISFILFERTKHIFKGWINQLLNYSLQPILLFAFLSFFIVLIDSALENILSVEICWTPVQHLEGQETESKFWRFVDEQGNSTPSDYSWNGLVSCVTQGGGACDDFPISIIDILTFLILAHLGYRFSDVVVNIATEIASSTLFLDKLRSGISEFVKQSEGQGTPRQRR